mgnify:CR=1 FL=1
MPKEREPSLSDYSLKEIERVLYRFLDKLEQDKYIDNDIRVRWKIEHLLKPYLIDIMQILDLLEDNVSTFEFERLSSLSTRVV